MMKSHFRLTGWGDKEEVEEEQTEVATHGAEEKQIVRRRGTKRLDKHEISVRLSWLGKTATGDGYTYLKATCRGMGLSNINSLSLFKYLQFVDVSNNNLTTEAIQAVTKLPYLVLIQADSNKLQSAGLGICKYLQVIIMNHNDIATVEDVFQPELSTFEVAYNKLTNVNFINRMSTLKILDCRYNSIRDLSTIDCPNLDSLYLAGNKIKDLSGIERLQTLRVLHLRNNPIKKLDFFEKVVMPTLEYLNLRNCKIRKLKDVKKLKDQPKLATLILTGTPYLGGQGKEDPDVDNIEDDPQKLVDVLATIPRLKKLNKTIYTQKDRVEARALMETWQAEHLGEEEEEEAENEEEEVEEDEESPPEELMAEELLE